jgi:glutamine---fructose-6-phosphate transaminase (isomerizing)
MALIDEIREQPAVVERLLQRAGHELEPVARLARRNRIDYAFIAARGSSDHAGVYAQYALGGIGGLPVALATPSLFSRYDAAPRLRRCLVVGISQSGQSPDVVAVLEEARRQGARTLAMTNDPASPLAAAAETVLDIGAGPERSIAATKTYTAQLAALAALAVALGPSRERHEALARLPQHMAEGLRDEDGPSELAAGYGDMDECIVVGRGYNLATALEWGLKLKELALIRAQAYSAADYAHGPIASFQAGGHVLAVVAHGALHDDVAALLERLTEERRARTLVLAADRAGGATLAFPDRLPEWLSPLLAILPAQLFTAALTEIRGLDAEHPRGLAKVTLTR